MEISKTATRAMAEEHNISDVSSAVSSPCNEEASCIAESMLSNNKSDDSGEIDCSNSIVKGTSHIDIHTPDSTAKSVSSPLEVYKVLQAHGLTNLMSAHQKGNLSPHGISNKYDADSESGATDSESGASELVTAQTYLNMAIYRHMLSNVIASQSPYMSLIGSLLSNIRTVSSNVTESSDSESHTPEVSISRVTSNDDVSLLGTCNQGLSIEKISDDLCSSLAGKSSNQEKASNTANKVREFIKRRGKNRGLFNKRINENIISSRSQNLKKELVGTPAVENESIDLKKLVSQSNTIEKATTTDIAYSKRKPKKIGGDKTLTSSESNVIPVRVMKNANEEIVQRERCLEINDSDSDDSTLKNLKKFRKVNASEKFELEAADPVGDFENNDAITNTKDICLEQTSKSGGMELSSSHPESDVPASIPRRKYKKREKKSDEFEKEENKFSCNICGKTFKLESSLTKHTWLHTGQQPFTCSVCEKKFTEKSNLTTHMRIHTGEKPHICSVCGRRFTQQASLMYHIRCHTGEKPYECKMCKKSFVSSSGLNSHMISHSTYKPFKCEVCDNCFARKSGLDLHMMVHTGEKPFECKECGKMFTQRGALTSHTKQHTGERRFRCEVCGKTFVDNCTLKKHLRIHSGDFPYQCELCGKRFLHRTSYIEHMKVHNDERTYPCSVCGKLFRNKSSVNTHMVTHTKEKPHECEECGKRFALKSNLKHHMKIHVGSREFVCEVCGQAFLFKDTLREHFKTHTGEKTYNCQVCGKGYMWKPSFLRHMDEIHGLNPEDNLEAFTKVRGRYRDTYGISASENIESVVVGEEQNNDSENKSVITLLSDKTADVLECAEPNPNSQIPSGHVNQEIVEQKEMKIPIKCSNKSTVRIKVEDESDVIVFEHEHD